jgi:surfeit locus 1 family protein
MPAGYSFRPRLLPWAIALLACAAGIALGQWQTRRAEEKRAAAKQLEDKKVELNGTLLPQHTVLLDNKIRDGRAGYEVLMPLKLADGRCVLVNRGWIAAGPTRDALPQVRTPAGEVRIEGIAREHLPRALQLAGAPQTGKLRQNLELQAFAAETGLALAPFFVEQRSALDDGLVRDWPRPDSGVEKHEAYALQWYSLAALAVVLAAVLSFRKIEKPA